MRKALKNIELRARALVPERIKKIYRVARVLALHQPARQIPQHQLDGALICASRYDLLSRLPHGGVVALLGARQGHFARAVMAAVQPKALHIVDANFASLDVRGLDSLPVIRHEGRCATIAAAFPPGRFDWIYIDSERSHGGVSEAARAAATALKPGGYLVFSNFAHVDPRLVRFGVMRAVSDFMIETGWEMAYFAFDRDALYDVALRKPERS